MQLYVANANMLTQTKNQTQRVRKSVDQKSIRLERISLQQAESEPGSFAPRRRLRKGKRLEGERLEGGSPQGFKMQLGKTLLKQVDTGWEQEVEVRYIIPPKFRWILRAWGDTSCQPAAYAVEHCLL